MTDLQMRSAQPTSTHPVYPGGHPLSAERAAILAADPERERLITQMLAATSEEEIAAARRAQEMWLAANPDVLRGAGSWRGPVLRRGGALRGRAPRRP